MKELGITKGEWKINKTSENLHDVYCPEFSNWFIVENIKPNDAKLIADAGTTANKTNLLPSELLERYNEAIEVIESYLSVTDLMRYPTEEELNICNKKAKQTISKAKNHEQ